MSTSPEYRWFSGLVDAHGAAVLGLLRRLCGNVPDADDVFQEVALRVWKSYRGRPLLRNPRSWLMTIAYRAFLDFRSRRPSHVHYEEHIDSRQLSPVAVAESTEMRLQLDRLIDGLSEPLRDVVVLHYVGGQTLSQVAVTMEVSLGTVKSRLNAALAKLRKELE